MMSGPVHPYRGPHATRHYNLRVPPPNCSHNIYFFHCCFLVHPDASPLRKLSPDAAEIDAQRSTPAIPLRRDAGELRGGYVVHQFCLYFTLSTVESPQTHTSPWALWNLPRRTLHPERTVESSYTANVTGDIFARLAEVIADVWHVVASNRVGSFAPHWRFLLMIGLCCWILFIIYIYIYTYITFSIRPNVCHSVNVGFLWIRFIVWLIWNNPE